jgi:hypothetical protein
LFKPWRARKQVPTLNTILRERQGKTELAQDRRDGDCRGKALVVHGLGRTFGEKPLIGASDRSIIVDWRRI